MTKKKGEVKPFKKKEEVVPVEQDVREEMTPEEIQAYMEQEEAELNSYLTKFKQAPQPDSSKIEEEDEEETITLDFDEGKAYEKVVEGVAVRHEDGSIEMIEDEEVAERVKEKVSEAKPAVESVQDKYTKMITDRFMSKAIASLMERLNKVQMEAEKSVGQAGLGAVVGEKMGNAMYDTVQKQKNELRQAFSGGVVNYDKIPPWAKPYVDEHIQNALNTMIDFVERD